MSVLGSIKEVSRMLELPEEIVTKMLENALVEGYKKEFGEEYDNVSVKLDENSQKLEVFAIKKVVDKVRNPVLEISLDEAKRYSKDVGVGDQISVPIDISKFSRGALEAIKSSIFKQKTEIERDKVNSIFRNKIGEIITAKIANIRGKNIEVIVDLGNIKVDGILPYEHQMPEDHRIFSVGDTIKAVLIDIISPSSDEEKEDTKVKKKRQRESKLLLSRTTPEFIKKLFEQNIPEVSKGIVQVVAVGRIAGERSKVAVASKYQDVDPVGACIGVGGSRIAFVSKEVSGEKIDVVLWSGDIVEFARNVFGRDAIHSVEDRGNEVILKVYDSYLSRVVGKKLINITLFEKMIGKSVKVISIDVEKESTGEPPIEIEEDMINENTYVDYLPFDRVILNKMKEKGLKTIGSLIENLDNLKDLGFTPSEISHINGVINEYIEIEVEE
jgi:N utilization substance protein A